MSEKERCKPSVPKRILPLIAGAMWCGVGIMLSVKALGWLSGYSGNAFLFAVAGITFALLMRHFSFLKIADRNLDRIAQLPDRPCAFSFISSKSWLLVIFMITLGISLRHSPMPKEYLAVIYLGIGMGLLLAGMRYFRQRAT